MVYERSSGIGGKIFKGFALFIIITLGVTCGNLASGIIQVYVAGKVAEDVAKALKQSSEEEAKRTAAESQARMKRLVKEQAERNRQAQERQRERERQQVIQEKLRSTCRFWIDEYRKTGEELDRLHRNKSCRDAGITVQ